MSKASFVISGPFDTYSGYGARARDLAKVIVESNKYDVKLLPQRWGNTPWGFIDENPEWKFLEELFIPNLTQQPDVWAQVTIPNEFQTIGKYNIGFTAGIESTLCPADWLEGINRMNTTFVSSKFSKKVFEDTTYTVKDNRIGQPIKELKLERPIEVLFEGVDTNIYSPTGEVQEHKLDLSNIEEDFVFLFVGSWLPGDFGEDRKNIGTLIKAFCETFKYKNNQPALVLKTSYAGTSYIDKQAILEQIESIRSTVKGGTIPNIYLLYGDFNDKEINALYNDEKIKAMVSLTKGEGFGRPLLEFSTTGKPIITTNWSGHLDYLKTRYNVLLKGSLKNIHPSAANKWLLQEARWFNVNIQEVNKYLKDIYNNYNTYKSKASNQARITNTEFTLEKMGEVLLNRLDTLIPTFPKKVELNLPSLKKPTLPTLKKI